MDILFTKHAKERIVKRKLTEQEIIDSIKNNDNVIKKHGKVYYQKKFPSGTLEVCCEERQSILKVVSVYWL